MASILDTLAVRQAVLPISVEQYHRLGESGIIAENTELLGGVIVEKMITSPRHSWLVGRLADWFRERLPDGFHVRQEQPVTLADSEPEPDVAVVSGTPDDYRTSHPDSARLVIEVAVGSSQIDRAKGAIYAAAGIAEFWLVVADENAVEIFTEPGPSGYARQQRHTAPAVVCPGPFAGLHLELAALFG
jgi:Uma2 family endonuclease